MSGELLLINPRGRRRRRRANPHSYKRRRRYHARAANPRRRRRRNVILPSYLRGMTMSNPRRRRRRSYARNPMRHHRRRHRNPIMGGGLMRTVGALVKDAAIQSVGSVAIDYAFGFLKPNLPASLQNAPGSTLGVGDAVKLLFTALVGAGLARPTKGFSRQAAIGSMTVQLRYILNANLPTSITSQLGWYQPAPVVPGTRWTSASRGSLVRASPLLSGLARGHGGRGLRAIVNSGFPTLSSAPGMPVLMPNVVSAPSAIPMR